VAAALAAAPALAQLPGSAAAADYYIAAAGAPTTAPTTADAYGAAGMVADPTAMAADPTAAAAVPAVDPTAAYATTTATAAVAPPAVAPADDETATAADLAPAPVAAAATPTPAAAPATTPAATTTKESDAATAAEASAAPAPPPKEAKDDAPPPEGCTSALALVAKEFPTLPLHPIFQQIMLQPGLKGTFFVPTARAWSDFFTTMRQRQGNPEAPALIARYGQVLLYHLAQNVQVPISTPTPNMPRFAVETASTLNCGVGVTDNRFVVTKTPEAIYVTHGAGNATIVSQAMPYCGGEAYLVDQVLLPCNDVSALMGEVVNVPGPCRTNVESALVGKGLSYFNALLLASGVSKNVYASVRDFTIFAPSDAAIAQAADSGELPYAELFVKDKNALRTALAYHIVPQVALSRPDAAATRNLETLLQQGVGNATCPVPGLSWRPDGFVYGGTGSGKVDQQRMAQGCLANVFEIDDVLAPCCRPLEDVIGQADGKGLLADAKPGSLSAKALGRARDLYKKNARATVILPTDEAWEKLQKENCGKKLTDQQIEIVLAYLYSRADVTNGAVKGMRDMPTGLSAAGASAVQGAAKALKDVCPKGANATLTFAYEDDAAPVPVAVPMVAAPLGGAALGAAAPAVAAPAVAAPGAAAPAKPAAARPPPPAVITGDLAAKSGPAAASKPVAAAAEIAPPEETEEVPVAAAPASTIQQPLLLGGRRRLASAAEDGAGLLLPTDFTGSLGGASTGAVVDLYATEAGSGGPPTGPIFVVDGASKQTGRALGGIPVERSISGCNGALYFVDTVPLPCNFVNRKTPYAPARAAAALLPALKPQSSYVGAAFGLAGGSGPSLGGNATNATAASGAVGMVTVVPMLVTLAAGLATALLVAAF
jgi:uncharacterized surface protein with fasciclin (FAS1) repeats